MSTDQQMQQAYQLIKQGRKEEAAALLVPIVRADNDNADAWWLLANAVGNADQAKRALQMVLRVRPDDDRARRMLAKLSGEPYQEPPPKRSAPPPVDDDPFAAAPPRTAKRSAPRVDDDDPFAQPMTPAHRRAAAMDQPFDDDPFAEPPPSKPAPRTGAQSKRSTTPSAARGTKPAGKRPPKASNAGDDDPFAVMDDFEGDPFTDLDLENGKRSRSKNGAAAPERRRSPALAILGLLLVIIIAVALAFVVLNQSQNQPTATSEADLLTSTVSDQLATDLALGTAIPGMAETLTAVAADPFGAMTAAAQMLADATLPPEAAATLTAVGIDPAAALTASAESLGSVTVEPGLAETVSAVAPEAALTLAATAGAELAETLSVQFTPGPDLSLLTRPPSLLQTTNIPDAQQTAFANAAQMPGIVGTLQAIPGGQETPSNAIVMTMVAQATALGGSSGAATTAVATMIAGGMGSTLPTDAQDQGIIAYGEIVSQNLPERMDHTWTFTGEAGDAVIIDLSAVGDVFDPQLILFDPEGTAVAENDDVDLSQNNRSSHIEFTLTESGTYTILVSAFGGESGAYELGLRVDR